MPIGVYSSVPISSTNMLFDAKNRLIEAIFLPLSGFGFEMLNSVSNAPHHRMFLQKARSHRAWPFPRHIFQLACAVYRLATVTTRIRWLEVTPRTFLGRGDRQATSSLRVLTSDSC